MFSSPPSAFVFRTVSFRSRLLPENSVWMEDAKLKGLEICHPQVSRGTALNCRSQFACSHVLLTSFLACLCVWSLAEEHLQQDLWRFPDEESLRTGLGQRLLLRVSGGLEGGGLVVPSSITIPNRMSVSKLTFNGFSLACLLLQRVATQPGGCGRHPLSEAGGDRLPAAAVLTGWTACCLVLLCL